MRARRSVWSNPQVQSLLAEFIPAADEVYRLHKGDGPECELFRGVSEVGHYAGRTEPSDTRQGMYALTPSGRLLASANSQRASEIARLLETALERWNAMPETDRFRPEGTTNATPLRHRAEHRYPADGLVLRVTSRDLPAPGVDPDGAPRRGWSRGNWRVHAWNHDYAWFQAKEMLEFIPRTMRVGERRALPGPLARRLVRLHLVDNVRGQTHAFAARHVQDARIESRITALTDQIVHIELTGHTRAVAPGSGAELPEQGRARRGLDASDFERGVETTLLGTARFDRNVGRFVHFELVALGTRWGGSRFNSRIYDMDPAPIGFVFALTGEDPPVAPAFIWSY